MTRVLLTGGSGFIAAHCLDQLLKRGHSVVTTVRSTEKAQRIKAAYPDVSKDKLDFAIVEDIAQHDAFDKAVISEPPFEVVIHTASPFHFNATDMKRDLLDPGLHEITLPFIWALLISLQQLLAPPGSSKPLRRALHRSSASSSPAALLPLSTARRDCGQTTYTLRKTGTQ